MKQMLGRGNSLERRGIVERRELLTTRDRRADVLVDSDGLLPMTSAMNDAVANGA